MVPNQSPTILIVEDELMARAGIMAAMEDEGWLVVAVGSGEEAILLLDQPSAIDLVFTDIHLAGTADGWDVGRASKTAGDAPVVYTSGKPLAHPVAPGHFFSKPYDPVAVAEACRHLLRH